MLIKNISKEDIPLVFDFYKNATELMKSKGQVHWPQFSQELVKNEIKENRQWKLLIDEQVACIWAIALEDELIWGAENNEPSIFIHRIATSSKFRGRGLVKEIVSWAKKYANENELKYIRMDTVGLNHGLINHYKKQGFEFLGTKSLKDTSGLPAHYQEGEICYFQIKV